MSILNQAWIRLLKRGHVRTHRKLPNTNWMIHSWTGILSGGFKIKLDGINGTCCVWSLVLLCFCTLMQIKSLKFIQRDLLGVFFLPKHLQGFIVPMMNNTDLNYLTGPTCWTSVCQMSLPKCVSKSATCTVVVILLVFNMFNTQSL